MHRLFICTLALLCAHEAEAGFFCVNNSATLTSALATAASNGEDDQIRLRSGTYLTPGMRFEVLAESGRSLQVSGGWIDFISPCSLQTGQPDATVLSAQAVAGVQVMRVRTPAAATGTLSVSNMTLVEGRGLGTNAGCMNVEVPSGSTQVTLDRIALFGCFNAQTLAAGALSIAHSGSSRLIFRNSTVVGSGAQSGAAVFLRIAGGNSIINFRSNSVVANSVISTGSLSAGIQADAASASVNAGIEIYDNVIVSNGESNQFDLSTLGTRSQIFTYYNVLSKAIDGESVEIGNRLVSNPAALFASLPDDLRPRPDSILRDGGSPELLPGLGELDHAGLPRIQNQRLDVGAHEFESLLRDSFE